MDQERKDLFFWQSKLGLTASSETKPSHAAQITPLIELRFTSPSKDRLLTATDLLAQAIKAPDPERFDLKGRDERMLFANDMAYFFTQGLVRSPSFPFSYSDHLYPQMYQTLSTLYPQGELPIQGGQDQLAYREYQRALALAAKHTVTTLCREAEEQNKLDTLFDNLQDVLQSTFGYRKLNKGNFSSGFNPSEILVTPILTAQRNDIRRKRQAYGLEQASSDIYRFEHGE